MPTPKITTAIPKRRYSVGEFNAIVLGEVESPDPQRYKYIFALVPEGAHEPVFYIVSQFATGEAAEGGSHLMRVVTEQGEQVYGVSDRWGDLEAFSEEALMVTRKLLGMMDEAPHRLL